MIWSMVFTSLFARWLPAGAQDAVAAGLRIKTPSGASGAAPAFAPLDRTGLPVADGADEVDEEYEVAAADAKGPAESEPEAEAAVGHEGPVAYASAGDTDQVLEVFYPPAGTAKQRALLFMVSGGFYSGREHMQNMTPLLEGLARHSGYTVFAIQHRSQPKAVIAEINPQITRAIRFVRASAARFDVDPERLALIGFSSGGYLSVTAGVSGDDGQFGAADPVERASSRVQAVVAFFPPTDFLNYGQPGEADLGTGVLAPFRRSFFHREPPEADPQAYGRAISPRYRVCAAAAPLLLIHGDKDPLVPLQQSQTFQAALNAAGGHAELIVKEGAGHGWPDMIPELTQAVAWLDKRLGVAAPAAAIQ